MDAAQTATADDLADLVGALREGERCIARAVLLAGRVAGSGVCESVEGLPLEHYLGLACRLTGADRRTLVAAGEALADLPCVAALFSSGALSWGQVRAIVREVRRLSRDGRAVVDERVAQTAREHGGLDAFDPDSLVDAVAVAVEELRAPRSVERSQLRRAEASFVALQAGFDGGVRGYFELDPMLGATVLGALDAAAGPPRPERPGQFRAPDPDDECDGGDWWASGGTEQPGPRPDAEPEAGPPDPAPVEPERGHWSSTSRGRQYARALGRLCADWLGGDTARPARPTVVVHVDLDQVGVNPSGTVELAVRGPLSRIGGAALEALARDADVRAVLFDGARPLAATAKVSADDICAATRRAVAARDLGCRFPGSADPLGHCDVHHLIEREHGGGHDPDNLAMLSRRFHTLVHRGGWTLRIHPPTGELTATRRGRRWRSLPRGTGLARAPDSPDDTVPF